MAVARRFLRYTLAGLGILILAVVTLVVALTRTGFGAERAGRIALDQLRAAVHGTVEVERITTSGNLLQGVTLHGVAITGPDGRPFIRADSARLSYRIRTLLRGSVVFDRLVVDGLDATLEKLPGRAAWNYDLILGDTTTTPDTVEAGPPGARSLVLIQNATVRDGAVTIRMPWEPDDPAADTSRLILESVPGGRVRTLRFEDVQVDLPRVVWQAPESESRLVEVENLAARGFIWETPFEMEELDGVVTIRDSLVSFEAQRARLPRSELSLIGRIVVGEDGERYDVEVAGDRVAFADFRWLHPPLPSEGGGSLRFRIQTLEDGRMLWQAEDAAVETRGNDLRGSFGLITGRTMAFTAVDVEARPLDLAFLAEVLPDSPPLTGLVIGTVEADGPLTGFRTRGDVRYRTFDAEGGGAESSIAWEGMLGARPPYVLRDMEAELRSVELAQVAHFAPGLRIRGLARGRLRAEGSIDEGLDVGGQVTLDHGEQQSAIQGSGRFALGGTPTFDLTLDAEPVRLELLAQQLPSLAGLQGDARGPVTVSGSLDDLGVNVDLMTPAGEVVVEAGLALTGERLGYRAEGSATEFRLDRVASGLPEMLFTGRFELDGSGIRLDDLDGRVNVDVLSASVGGLAVYRGSLQATVVDGLARVDSLTVATEAGDVSARGTFGLVEERPGELAVDLRADSLPFLEPLLFGDAVPVEMGEERSNRIDGLLALNGRVTGSVARWRVSGTARARSFLYEHLELGRGNVDVDWDPDSLRVTAALDSLRYGTRRLAAVQGTLAYADGRGRVDAEIRGRRAQRLALQTSFAPQGGMVDLGLQRMELTTRDGQWTLRDPATVAVGREGFRVDSMVLTRAPTDAWIRVTGVLPWRQPEADEVQVASLDIQLDRVGIGELLRVIQTDTTVDGVVTGGARVTGTARQPRIAGALTARSFRYGGAVLDSLLAEVRYESRVADGRLSGWEGGEAIVTGQGRVPVDLALSQTGRRLLDEPMDVEFHAAGVPAGLVAFLAPGFSDLTGRVEGRMAVVGTPVQPDLRGTMRLMDGSAYFEPLAVGYRDIQATARMVQGTDVELEATLATEAGRAEIQGTLDLTEPTDPAFDLALDARRLDGTRRRDVTAVVDGQAHVGGRYSRPVVSGDVRIIRGEMNLDEIWRQYQIVQLDTTLFQMLDTTQVSYRPAPENPFLENLQVTNMELTTRRNFWLRSQELNVEVVGDLSLEVDRQTDDLRLTGTLQVVEGSYQLLARSVPGGRRFEIRDGTIEFVGTPGIDPNLDIRAAYRVRRAQGEPIDVVAQVTGTLQDPRVELSSSADVPVSETDLASYILFGRASTELTQAELDVASARSLAVGFLRPAVSGVASSGLQRVAASLGLPVDYVAFSLPEYDVAQYRGAWETVGPAALIQEAQLEVGFDPSPNVSVIGSVRIPGSNAWEGTPSALRLFGARVEYRPWQTWTIEGYVEDQFARTPSFGPAQISDRKVLGLSLFREWGY